MTTRQSSGAASTARRLGSIRTAIVVVLTICAVVTEILVIGVVLALRPNGADPLTVIASSSAGLSLIIAGGVLVIRLPRNPISWILWAVGLAIAESSAAAGVADYGLNVNPGSVPGVVWLAWLNQLLPSAILGLIALMPLLYPTGRLPSDRWRIVLVLGVICLAIGVAQAAFSPFSTGTYPPGIENPVAMGGPAADILSVLSLPNLVVSGVVFLLVAASLAVRFRRAAGVERQQLKWFVFVGSIALVALFVGILTGAYVAWLIFFFGLALLPVAIGLAILRYRLYDLDLVIRRTLVYGALATFLALIYGGSVLVLSTALAPLTSGNSLAVAGGTLLVAALFSPVRRRVRTAVDRRFYRSRYDAAGELADLSRRLRSGVDLEGVRGEIAQTVSRTLQPASASLWLRSEGAQIRRR